MKDTTVAQPVTAEPTGPRKKTSRPGPGHKPASVWVSDVEDGILNAHESTPTLTEQGESVTVSSLTQRLRKTTDSFDFDALLSPTLSMDQRSSTADAAFREEQLAAPEPEPASPHSAATMVDLIASAGADVTARLVAELTRTTDRLEKLEATLREVSLLNSLQHEPANMESAPVPPKNATDVNESNTAIPENLDGNADNDAEAYFRRGVELCQTKRLDEAIAAWQEVLRLQPDNTYAVANIGIAYTELAQWSEAQEMFARVVALDPDSPEGHYGLGMAYAQLGDYSAAFAALETSLQRKPDNPDARYNLALIQQRLALDNIGCGGAVGQVSDDQSDAPDVHHLPSIPAATYPTKNLGALGDPATHPLPSVPAATAASGLTNATVQEHAGHITAGRTSDIPARPTSAPSRLDGGLHSQSNQAEITPLLPANKRPVAQRPWRTRTLWITSAVVALAGFLIYLQTHPIHPVNGASAPPAFGPPAGNVKRITDSASPVVSTHVHVTPIPISPSPADAPDLSPTPRRVPARRRSAPIKHPRSTIAHRQPHHMAEPTGRRLGGVTPRMRHYHRPESVPARKHGSGGFNQGADKLLDRLP